jgi:transketolase
MTGPDGATHQATEDIASVRAWPIIQILVPCDSIEGRKATVAAGKTDGPFYIRFTRDKSPIITTEETPFEIGKSYIYWLGEKPQVTIAAMGYMLYYALLAAKELEEQGIQSEVINVASIKPLDEETILNSVKKTGALVRRAWDKDRIRSRAYKWAYFG